MQTVTDAQFVENLRAKSTRQVLAEFVASLGQLVMHLNLQHEVTELSVNFHGPAMRLDIATVDASGEHLAAWLLALDANPVSPTFSQRLELPNAGPVQ